jgi:hypothetical protein
MVVTRWRCLRIVGAAFLFLLGPSKNLDWRERKPAKKLTGARSSHSDRFFLTRAKEYLSKWLDESWIGRLGHRWTVNPTYSVTVL